jgi:hypothetical protein
LTEEMDAAPLAPGQVQQRPRQRRRYGEHRQDLPARQPAHARAPGRERAANLIGRVRRAFEDDGFGPCRPDGFERQNENLTAADGMPAGGFDASDAPARVRAVQIDGKVALLRDLDMKPLGSETLAQRRRLAVQRREGNKLLMRPPVAVAPAQP